MQSGRACHIFALLELLIEIYLDNSLLGSKAQSLIHKYLKGHIAERCCTLPIHIFLSFFPNILWSKTYISDPSKISLLPARHCKEFRNTRDEKLKLRPTDLTSPLLEILWSLSHFSISSTLHIYLYLHQISFSLLFSFSLFNNFQFL